MKFSPGCNCCGPCSDHGSTYLGGKCYESFKKPSFSTQYTDWIETWFKTRVELWQRWQDYPYGRSGGYSPHGVWERGTVFKHLGENYYPMAFVGHNSTRHVFVVDGTAGRIFRDSASYEDADSDSPRNGETWWSYPQPYWSDFAHIAPITWDLDNRSISNIPPEQPPEYEVNLQHTCEDDVAVGLKVFSSVGGGEFAKAADAEIANLIMYGPYMGSGGVVARPITGNPGSGFGVDAQHTSINDGDEVKLRWYYWIGNIDGGENNPGGGFPPVSDGTYVIVEGEADVDLEGEVEFRWEVSAGKYRVYETDRETGMGNVPRGRIQNCWEIRDVQLIIKFGGEVVHESEVIEKHFHNSDFERLTSYYAVGLNPLGASLQTYRDDPFWGLESAADGQTHLGDDDKLKTPYLRTNWIDAAGDRLPEGDWEYTMRWDQTQWYLEYPEVYTEVL